MNDQERIEVLIEHVGKASALAERIGCAPASVTKLRNGKFHIEAFAARIANAFPEVNCRWLLTGNGEPFAKEAAEGRISAELRALRKVVEELTAKVGERP